MTVAKLRATYANMNEDEDEDKDKDKDKEASIEGDESTGGE